MSDFSGPDFSWQKQMGYTHRELIRGLPRAVEPYQILDAGLNPIEMALDNRMVRLYIGREEWRAMSSLRIPLLSVRLDFFDFSPHQYEQFLHRFRTYLQRGGG